MCGIVSGLDVTLAMESPQAMKTQLEKRKAQTTDTIWIFSHTLPLFF